METLGLSAFCALHDCQAGDLPHLRLSAHEGAHSTGGWYRAWPPVRCGSACGQRPQPPDHSEIFKAFPRAILANQDRMWREIYRASRRAGAALESRTRRLIGGKRRLIPGAVLAQSPIQETRLEKLQSAWLADLDARYFAAEAAETKAEVGAGHRDTFPDYII
jgi:hypothetical protein